MNQSAFVLRVAPSEVDRVPQALEANQIIIGWSRAEGLLDLALSWKQFREIVRRAYYADAPSLRKAGSAAGNLWCFIREMKLGDLVAVPYGPQFYVAKVTGEATRDPALVEEDTAYRRSVEWLNDKTAIPRTLARSALLSRMKHRGTCAYAADLVGEIQECIYLASRGEVHTFLSDLHAHLVCEVQEQMLSGRIEDFGFERLIQTVLRSLGAEEVHVVARTLDQGADLIATFRSAGVFQQKIAVQAKHWRPDPPAGRDVVDQLIRGIEAEAANLGMLITSGSISDDAFAAAATYSEETGIGIELVDGEQFAKLIVEHGVCTS